MGAWKKNFVGFYTFRGQEKLTEVFHVLIQALCKLCDQVSHSLLKRTISASQKNDKKYNTYLDIWILLPKIYKWIKLNEFLTFSTISTLLVADYQSIHIHEQGCLFSFLGLPPVWQVDFAGKKQSLLHLCHHSGLNNMNATVLLILQD